MKKNERDKASEEQSRLSCFHVGSNACDCSHVPRRSGTKFAQVNTGSNASGSAATKGGEIIRKELLGIGFKSSMRHVRRALSEISSGQIHWPSMVDNYISLERPFLGITLAYYLHLVLVKKGFLKVQQWGTGWEPGAPPKVSLCVSLDRSCIRHII